MSEMEKDFCLKCGVEVFDGGSWGYCVPCGNAVFDKLIGDKLKATNNTRPNHAVGEVYKAGQFIDLQRDLNTHDPYNQHRWADEEASVPAWVWAMRLLGTLGFVVGIYALCLLTFLF